jgi:hypothetical protein
VFVIVELQTVFHTQFVGMFIKYPCPKFHMPSSVSLVIADKVKDFCYGLSVDLLDSTQYNKRKEFV